MKLQENKGVYFVTLPKDLIELAGWQKGDKVIIVPAGNNAMQIRKL